MAVAFMAALERTPESYDEEFDNVLEGRSSLIRERILEIVTPGMRVLDLGCGPGLFAIEAAKKGATVVGVDADANMIALAIQRAASLEAPPKFLHGSVLTIGEDIDLLLAKQETSDAGHVRKYEQGNFDLIVSTFLLSELKPPQRQLFMHILRTMLKKDGVFAIASETLPLNRSDKSTFWKNRAQAEKNANRRLPPPIADLEDIVSDAGLAISQSEKHGPEITFIIGKQGDAISSNRYQSRTKEFSGPKARTRIWHNHLTGGWRGIPIETGLYKSGNPSPDSPVIVTANYELTYYTVMRALAKDKIDAWVIVCDTAGINVWCAARGIHFDSEDVIQMIRITGLAEFVNHRELLFPQLAAAGMDPALIRERTGFRVRYGPVRIQDLSRWLELEKPRPKPKEMATVTFNLRERMEQTVAHIPFLFAAFLGKQILRFLGILAISNVIVALVATSLFSSAFSISLEILLYLGEFILALFGNALVLGVLFPILPSKGNSFWRRGLGLAGITLPIAATIMLILQVHWTLFVVWMVIQFAMSTSLTLDWSGMTSVSDPKVIRREYPYMIMTLKISTVFIVLFSLIAILMGW
ncbi:MAG: methyltransferase domain-containing protein [Candidatus Thorarchaeota archaeon]|jgi:cyclopropane fatty-acyl-phospholipid synthase-like methyltransferase